MDKKGFTKEFYELFSKAPRDINSELVIIYPLEEIIPVNKDMSTYDSTLSILEIQKIIDLGKLKNKMIEKRNNSVISDRRKSADEEKTKYLEDFSKLVMKYCTFKKTEEQYFNYFKNRRNIYYHNETNIYAVLKNYFYMAFKSQNIMDVSTKYNNLDLNNMLLEEFYRYFTEYNLSNYPSKLIEYTNINSFAKSKYADLNSNYEKLSDDFEEYVKTVSKKNATINKERLAEKQKRIAIVKKYKVIFENISKVKISDAIFEEYVGKNSIFKFLNDTNKDLFRIKYDFHNLVCSASKHLLDNRYYLV